MAGCLLGHHPATLTVTSRRTRHRLRWAMTFAIGLLFAGFVTDTFEGINKIAATPTWCFWSAALTCLVWMFLYWIIDVAGIPGMDDSRSTGRCQPAARLFPAPDHCRADRAWSVSEVDYSPIKMRATLYVVVGGSFGMALCRCVVTGLLGRLGLRARL